MATTRKYALAISAQRTNYGFFVLDMHIVQIQGDGKLRWSPYTFDEKYDVEGFRVYAQGSDNDRQGGVYAWAADYAGVNVESVDKAESILKVLKQIQRSLKAMREGDGDARSFGQFALRVCKALGITSMVDPAAHDRWTDQEYRQFSLADGAEEIDRRITAWQRTDETTRLLNAG